jgi:hypothetical protein
MMAILHPRTTEIASQLLLKMRVALNVPSPVPTSCRSSRSCPIARRWHRFGRMGLIPIFIRMKVLTVLLERVIAAGGGGWGPTSKMHCL